MLVGWAFDQMNTFAYKAANGFLRSVRKCHLHAAKSGTAAERGRWIGTRLLTKLHTKLHTTQVRRGFRLEHVPVLVTMQRECLANESLSGTRCDVEYLMPCRLSGATSWYRKLVTPVPVALVGSTGAVSFVGRNWEP